MQAISYNGAEPRPRRCQGLARLENLCAAARGTAAPAHTDAPTSVRRSGL